MQLSKHFKLEEMTKSMTAQRKGIDNTPGAGDIKNLENVCYEILEPVRAKFDKPVTVTSGYRSEELCEAIGSKKTSQHAKGQAVDFEIAGIPNIQIAYWLALLPFDQDVQGRTPFHHQLVSVSVEEIPLPEQDLQHQ